MKTPLNFTENYLISESVLSDLHFFFKISNVELNYLLAVVCLQNDKNFNNIFTKKDLAAISYKHLNKMAYKTTANNTMKSLAEKGFFVFVSNTSNIKFESHNNSFMARYSLNKEKFDYFICVFQSLIKRKTKDFKQFKDRAITNKKLLNMAKKDVTQHIRKMKKLGKIR